MRTSMLKEAPSTRVAKQTVTLQDPDAERTQLGILVFSHSSTVVMSNGSSVPRPGVGTLFTLAH